MSVRGSTKSKVMIQSREGISQRETQNRELGAATAFTCFGCFLTISNHKLRWVGCRISEADRASLYLPSLHKTKFHSRESRVTIYKTLIRPIVLYGSETLTPPTFCCTNYRFFESTILGPVQVKGTWRESTVKNYTD
jgi:hypothetical protein